MPLEVGDFRAAEEDILTSTGRALVLLDLHLHDLRRVLDDLGNVGPVTRAHFTKNALIDPDNTSDEPIALSNLHGKLFNLRSPD